MKFIDKIVDGFNKVLQFLGALFKPLFDLISSGFQSLMEFLAKPLGWLMYFLEGIFYFFEKVFAVIVLVIKIFTAMFQYLGALIAGVFRFIGHLLSFNISANTKFVSSSDSGFATVIDLLQPTGLLTVVPIVATALLWIFFCMKVFSAIGGVSFSSFISGRGDDKL